MEFLLRRDLYEDIKHNKKNSPACLVLYFVVIVLAVTEGGSIISGRKSRRHVEERRLHNHSERFIINPM